ncbi:beta-glucosidase 12-like [Corylus avellana]|uniref:beta-glucosidase 12-like n=1 Tax=Corylus avellana TaxID=13451 RepID=UPI00286B722B|nr:beta-glucosidase 12-like [Corylus avellana]XP_059449564.1 beta-glucosidase 12-like [Corylus avellana]XP_059449565.1 beta-glucosidase 12-like [Corylus avellana]
MAVHQGPYLFCLLALVLASLTIVHAEHSSHTIEPFNRSSFPTDFIFGTATAAYMIEGATNIDGRGPCTWDIFVKRHPEKIRDGKNADVACDFYHRYKEDIQLLKTIGLDSFKFSISWTRVLPKGKISGGVNPQGVKFYNDLINELLSNGIKPLVFLMHFDPPQALEDEYDGPLSPKFVNDFQDYADFCFKTFGDRVKLWVTMNEPIAMSIGGYSTSNFPPGRCSSYVPNCTAAGNSATELYIVGHNLLLAHGAVVKLYKDNYQPHQKGQIGLAMYSTWVEPKDNTSSSHEAASRYMDFVFGWFVEPVIYGDYPERLKFALGSRLPKFTEAQSKLVKGSIDFLGLSYYSAGYAKTVSPANGVNVTFWTDVQANITSTGYIQPEGLRKLLLYIKGKYDNPAIYITENGIGGRDLQDVARIKYYHLHLLSLSKAIKEGANVKAHYSWSFLDGFEWDNGYLIPNGLIFVDFKDNLKRHLKDSCYWFKKFLLK